MPRARVEDYTDPYVWTFVPPPLAGDGVCDVCHGAPNPGFTTCYSCSQTTAQVSRPVRLVVPISLYVTGEQLWHVLRNYKDGMTEALRAELRPRVAALLYRFLDGHRQCIANATGADWNIITTVPSSQEREGEHPLERVVRMARALTDEYEALLEPGPGEIGHNRARDDGYTVTRDVEGEHVLLVDDTFTSGARVQSAASALQLAGATVAAAVPIGRVINPEWNEAAQTLWGDARAREFDFDTCCLEPGP